MFSIGGQFFRNFHIPGWNRWATAGTALVTISVIASKCLSEQQKNTIVSKSIRGFRDLANLQHVSEEEVRGTWWYLFRSFINLAIPSPLFYIGFGLIHKLGMRASFKNGCIGTLVTLPPLAGLHLIAAFVLPFSNDRFRRCGYSHEKAAAYSKGIMFFLIGAPAELALEFKGFGVTRPQLKFILTSMGIAFMACRIGAGTLNQYNAIEKGKFTVSALLDDLVFSQVGTTISQHLLNGVTRSSLLGKGTQGFKDYLWTGDAIGNGNLRTSRTQLLKTFGSRIVYVAGYSTK